MTTYRRERRFSTARRQSRSRETRPQTGTGAHTCSSSGIRFEHLLGDRAPPRFGATAKVAVRFPKRALSRMRVPEPCVRPAKFRFSCSFSQP